MVSVDLASEKHELDAMVERLSRSPRLSRLLQYIGDRYLRGEDASLREFDIATEVFGRPADFDQSTDAIARVEVHRLRKKLGVYYQTEGRNNPVRISIPAGSYRTVFTHQSDPASAVQPPPPLEVPAAPPANAPDGRRGKLRLALILALAVALAGGVAWVSYSKLRTNTTPDRRLSQNPAISVSSPLANGVGAKPVRILAGYDGQPHIDPAGNTWYADRFFDRGGGWHGTQVFTGRTNDEFLYRTYRTGEFAYAIPLGPGPHELHLFFDETAYGPGLGGGEGSRSFSILLNHQPLFQFFDIVSDAMGPNIADERVIRDVGPGADGKLHLEFEGVSGKPMINALEILPGQLHKQLPIRLTTQATPFLDRAGNIWSPDNFFLGGQSSLQKPPVAGTNDAGLFAMERYGHFSYALPVDPRGTYSLTLYFAEFYFGPDGEGKGGIGSRRFNVLCNGTTLLNDFDIYREVGTLHAITKTFHHLKPSPQGKLNLTFEPVTNFANISALEVTDESR